MSRGVSTSTRCLDRSRSCEGRLLRLSRTDVEQIVLTEHSSRARNTGAADWLIVSGRLSVAYNHPDGGDETMARIVTLWRRA